MSLWVIEGGEHVMDEEGWVVGREDMMKEKEVRKSIGRSILFARMTLEHNFTNLMIVYGPWI